MYTDLAGLSRTSARISLTQSMSWISFAQTGPPINTCARRPEPKMSLPLPRTRHREREREKMCVPLAHLRVGLVAALGGRFERSGLSLDSAILFRRCLSDWLQVVALASGRLANVGQLERQILGLLQSVRRKKSRCYPHTCTCIYVYATLTLGDE